MGNILRFGHCAGGTKLIKHLSHMEYLALVRRAQKHEEETKKIIKAWKKQVKNHLLTNVDALFNHVS